MNEIYKTCARCKEDWPPDEEFYFKPTDTTCRACKYEVEQERNLNRKKQLTTSS